MEITRTFTVAASVGAVWALLTDPYRVAACLPGAAITGQVDEKTWTGTITVKVGPVSTSYRGTVVFERLDATARIAEVAATGQDVKGKGGAQMKMTSRLVERGGDTDVSVVSAVAVTGILAQMGRGMIQDVSDRMFEQFAVAMQAQLVAVGRAAGGGAGTVATASLRASEPVQMMSLGIRVIGSALARAALRPATWIVVLVIVVTLWWVMHR